MSLIPLVNFFSVLFIFARAFLPARHQNRVVDFGKWLAAARQGREAPHEKSSAKGCVFSRKH